MANINLLKGLLSPDEEIYGKKPIVPSYDPFASYKRTIGENIGLAPEAMKLADVTNQYNLRTRTGMFDMLMPGYSRTLGTVAQNLGARARGEIAPDVLSRIGREGAAWAVGSGVGRAPMADFRNLRNYGRTSMDAAYQAEGDIANWLRTLTQTSLPETVDIRDYSINPATRLTDEFARDKLAAELEAAPDPAERGLFDSQMGLLGMILSAYGGGGGYQNYNRPAGQGSPSPGAGQSGGSWWSRMLRPSYDPPSYRSISTTGY